KLIADRHGASVMADLPALLKQVEAVSVAATTSAHYGVVKACLEAGVHVLVEKPIAVTPAEAWELVELAQQRKRVLQVGHIERFNPVMQALRPHIGKPVFIECHRLSPFGERGTDVDVVLDLMIHDLDLVLSLHPGPVEDIRAAGVPVLTSSNDIANARIEFQSGCVANLTASRVSAARMRRLRLFQRDAYLSADFQTRKGIICRRRTATGERPVIDTETVQGGEDEPLKLEVDAFLTACATGQPPPVTGADGAAALDLAYRVLGQIEGFARRHGMG
ncbi:MAG: Gfo/Idh/MocA family oxidoreductase, partial [Nitrospirota bacterium]|nr:Gfo/Idh/MocA family oxidoreductase [Nitrospirota bacterium]